MRQGLAAKALACGLVVALAACAPSRGPEYGIALARAKRANSAGRLDEAAAAYREAAATAKLPRDKNYARYLAALTDDRLGKRAEAERELRALGTLSPPSEYSPMAAYRAALIAMEAGRPADAELDAVVRTYPESGAARSALRHRLLGFEAKSEDPRPYLKRVAVETRGTAVEQVARYQHAQATERLGEKPQALAEYTSIAEDFPYPKGVHRDDALFRASELAEQAGDGAAAVKHLESLLADREQAHVLGTYERPKYGAAAERIATLQEQVLKNPERAAQAWHRLYADFPTSIRRDDALWNEARILRALGRNAEACDRLDTLRSQFEDSRFARCVTTFCPSLTPKSPPKGSAPEACHEYLTRAPDP
jgi:tetratricopeptide (TPR) repeat protein